MAFRLQTFSLNFASVSEGISSILMIAILA